MQGNGYRPSWDEEVAAAKQRRVEAIREAEKAAMLAAIPFVKANGGPLRAPSHSLRAFIDTESARALLSERERRLQIAHVVPLALEPPAVDIAWVSAGTHADRLLRPAGGVSLGGKRAIAVPPILTIEDVATCLHEIGHQRDLGYGGRVSREAAAWRWAIEHALYWDFRLQRHMKECLSTYLQAATDLRDVVDVAAAEALISQEGFRAHERPQHDSTEELRRFIDVLVEQFEETQFFETHGRQRCQDTRFCLKSDALATAIDADKRVCRQCDSRRKSDRDYRKTMLLREMGARAR